MQNCDLSGQCSQRFSYSLAEFSASQMEDLAKVWAEQRNKDWDAKLVVGAAPQE